MTVHLALLLGITAIRASFSPSLNFLLFKYLLSKPRGIHHPEAFLTTPEIISYNGYTSETHVVVTEDGYILEMFRIPRRKEAPPSDPMGSPVLLIHGCLQSSVAWILNSVNNSIAFLLADEGYDVWLGNLRGSTYSLHHTFYSSYEEKYWDFSFDEHGRIDIPTMIDHVIKVTGKSQVILIGHATGTTSIFATLSNKTEYNDKVKGFIALAPTTTLGSHQGPILSLFFDFLDVIHTVNRLLGIYWLPGVSLRQGCMIRFPIICRFLNILIMGHESPSFNKERIPVIFSQYPDISSMKSAIHFKQVFYNAEFAAFDYGSHERNKRKYGVAKAPEYNLSLITVPVKMFSSTNDKYLTLEAAEEIARHLSDVQLIRSVPFIAMDFFFSTDVRLVLFPVLSNTLQQLTDKNSPIVQATTESTTQATEEESTTPATILMTSIKGPPLDVFNSSADEEKNRTDETTSNSQTSVTDFTIDLTTSVEDTGKLNDSHGFFFKGFLTNSSVKSLNEKVH